jgi:hypothetical protein
MKKISGFQPDDLKNNSFRPEYQPSCSEGKPERLEEMPFLIADVAPQLLQHIDAFINLTAFAIGLTFPSIPTSHEGVKSPSTANVRTTCFDVWLLAVPGLMLDAFVRLLATSGRPVDVEVFLTKNFNMLIINFFCSKPVDKNSCIREFIFSGYQFFVVTSGLDHHIRGADMTRRFGFPPLRLFCFLPHQPPHRPSTTTAPIAIRTRYYNRHSRKYHLPLFK